VLLTVWSIELWGVLSNLRKRVIQGTYDATSSRWWEMSNFISIHNTKMIKTGKKLGIKIGTYALNPSLTCGKTCKGCYYMRLKRFPAVFKKATSRYYETKQRPWVKNMINEINAKSIDVIRCHDGGDIYSDVYMKKIVRLARLMPNKLFYFYTQKVKRVKKHVNSFPENLIPIYSLKRKTRSLINTNTDRHARVFKTMSELLKAGYHSAMDNDLEAINPNHIKIGLVYHGVARFEDSEFNVK